MRKWDDEWNYYLLTIPAKHWRLVWPENTQDALHTRKKKLKRDITGGSRIMPEKPKDFDPERTPEELHEKLHQKLGELLTPGNFDPDNLPDGVDVSYHYGYIKNAEGEIEYTKPLPSVRRGKGTQEIFPPAVAANITPSRRKVPNRPYKTLFVFSDAQIDYRRIGEELVPIHDERAMRIARLICRDVQPETIVNLGDTVDLAALSRFKPDSDHFHRTLGPAFQRVHDMYAQLRSDNPKAKIIEVDSNHNKRLKDFVLGNMPQLYGVRQAGSEADDFPVMSYPHLANLKPLGVEWVSGYGAAEYVYGEDYDGPPIIFKHGTTMVSNGSTANKESKDNPETHVVRGHGHRLEKHTRTNRAGQYLTSLMIGAMAKNTGEVPSYHSGVSDMGEVVRYQENWQQSVLVIRDYAGYYQFDDIAIIDGRAFYNGREYRADE
jgi:hypothetical protein